MIACGDHDDADPGHPPEEMAAVLPDSELVVVPGAGHLVQLEAPQIINDALVRLVERATPSKTRCADPSVEGADPACVNVWATFERPRRAPWNCPPSRTPWPSGNGWAGNCARGDVVVLSGPLGAGKTALTKGIALGMDVEGPVTSPTFVLARVHRPRGTGGPRWCMSTSTGCSTAPVPNCSASWTLADLDTDLEDAVVVVEWG